MKAIVARKLWFALFVLVVFCLGAAAGVVADRYRASGRRPIGFGRFGMGVGMMRGGPPRPAEIADRMSRELDLTAEQRKQLEAVLERNGDRLEQFRRETAGRFETLRTQLDAEISGILTPEQRRKFEEQRKRRGRNRPLREAPRPPGR
jgi:Spy/CpxP family protein refolding chaperone